MVGASYAGLDTFMVVLLFTLSMGFLGNFFTGVKVNALDLSPNYSGSLVALTNGMAGMAGVVVLPIVGLMTPDSSLEQWRLVFWITLAVSIGRAIIFIVWGTADVQPWNNPRRLLSPESGIKEECLKNGKENLNHS